VYLHIAFEINFGSILPNIAHGNWFDVDKL